MEDEIDPRRRFRHEKGSGGGDRVASGVRVSDANDDVGVAEARRRFGGIDVPATLAGMEADLRRERVEVDADGGVADRVETDHRGADGAG